MEPEQFCNIAGWPALLRKGKAVLYDPHKSALQVININDIGGTDLRQFVVKHFGFKGPAKIPKMGPPFKIACATITGRCNMKCPYCFVYPVPHEADMSTSLARRVVSGLSEWMVEPRFQLHIWGGEPTQNPTGLKALVKAASQYRPQCHVLLTTNGCMDPKLLRWLSRFDNLRFQISLDGPPAVQTLQKRLKSGEDSYQPVARTIQWLVDQGRPPIIRLTVTNRNVTSLAQDVGEYIRNGWASVIGVEPVHTYVGRSVAQKKHQPIVTAYTGQLFKALSLAEQAGIQLYSQSLLSIRSGMSHHRGFVNILPDGQAVSTIAVVDASHPRFKSFHLGSFSAKTSRLQIDTGRVQRLEERFEQNVARFCLDCPIYALCGGAEQRDLFSTTDDLEAFDDSRCKMFRGVVQHWLGLLADEVEKHTDSALASRYEVGILHNAKNVQSRSLLPINGANTGVELEISSINGRSPTGQAVDRCDTVEFSGH